KRGLGLATGRPLYVVDVDPERNTVRVGEAPDLERDWLVATAVNFIAGEPPKAPLRVEAEIRNSHRPVAAQVRAPDGARAAARFGFADDWRGRREPRADGRSSRRAQRGRGARGAPRGWRPASGRYRRTRARAPGGCVGRRSVGAAASRRALCG